MSLREDSRAVKVAPPPPEPKYVLQGAMGPVSCIEFGSEDVLYAGTEDGWIHIWDLMINRMRTSFQVGNSACLAVKVAGDRIITQIKGKGFAIWTKSEKFTEFFRYHYSYIGFCRVELNWNQTFIYLPAENSEVKVFGLSDNKISSSIDGPVEKVGDVMILKYAMYSGREILFICYESGHIYLWDLTTVTLLNKVKLDNVPMAIDFDADVGKGVCGTESDAAVVFKIDDDFKFSIEKFLTLKNPGVSSIVIRPDKKVVVLGCWDGNIRVYAWKSGRILGVLSEHSETINALCYSSQVIPMWNSIILAAASKDKTISLWSFL